MSNNPALSLLNGLLKALTREDVLDGCFLPLLACGEKLQAFDLGLDPDDVTNRLISLGHKKFFPREALATFAIIESRAHALTMAMRSRS